MLQLVSQLFQIVSGAFLLLIKLVLSLFPFYQQLSGLQTEIIAAALGVSPVVITVGIKAVKGLISVIKRR